MWRYKPFQIKYAPLVLSFALMLWYTSYVLQNIDENQLRVMIYNGFDRGWFYL